MSPALVSGGPGHEAHEASQPSLWPYPGGAVCRGPPDGEALCVLLGDELLLLLVYVLVRNLALLLSSCQLSPTVSPLRHGPELVFSGLCEIEHEVPPERLIFPRTSFVVNLSTW